MLYITDALLELLLERARDREPQSVSIKLAVEPAKKLDLATEIDPETPVFADYYFPTAGDSITAVFGMDFSIPPGQTQGIFISHPQGPLAATERDEFAERVIIAVPPWKPENVAAFDRSGNEYTITVVSVSGDARDDRIPS